MPSEQNNFDLKRTDLLLGSMAPSNGGSSSSNSNSLPTQLLSRRPPRLPLHKDQELTSEQATKNQEKKLINFETIKRRKNPTANTHLDSKIYS